MLSSDQKHYTHERVRHRWRSKEREKVYHSPKYTCREEWDVVSLGQLGNENYAIKTKRTRAKKNRTTDLSSFLFFFYFYGMAGDLVVPKRIMVVWRYYIVAKVELLVWILNRHTMKLFSLGKSGSKSSLPHAFGNVLKFCVVLLWCDRRSSIQPSNRCAYIKSKHRHNGREKERCECHINYVRHKNLAHKRHLYWIRFINALYVCIYVSHWCRRGCESECMPEHDQINSNQSTVRPRAEEAKTRWKWRWNFILNHKYCQNLFYRFSTFAIKTFPSARDRQRWEVAVATTPVCIALNTEWTIDREPGSIVKWK